MIVAALAAVVLSNFAGKKLWVGRIERQCKVPKFRASCQSAIKEFTLIQWHCVCRVEEMVTCEGSISIPSFF